MAETETAPPRLGFPADELRARTARGAVLNAVFIGGTQAIALAQALIATAILGPVGIALYGIVSITAMTIVELKRVGVDEAFVQQAEPDQEAEFQKAWTVELTLSAFAAGAIILLAPLVTLAYGESRLLPLMLAVAYLPLAFALQAPAWVFFRRMDFLRVRALQAIVPVGSFLVAVPLLAADVGVWSLVIGPFVASLVAVAVCWRASPFQLALRPDRDARRRYLRFSWPIFAATGALLVVQQGQLLAFDLTEGLAAAGYITLAATLTRYADRVDQILATTIYPALCSVRDRRATLEELFTKSNRLGLAWSVPFCAAAVLFAPDLIEFVIGDDWQPAVGLLQGIAVATGLQQLGYNWFSFYRAVNDPRPQAYEGAVMVGSFLVLALPGLIAWGFDGFVAGRIAGAVLVLLVRRRYVRRLLPGVSLARLAARGLAPVAGAAALVMALRLLSWGERDPFHAVVEIAVFVASTAALTWLFERRLLDEAAGYLRGTPAAAPAA